MKPRISMARCREDRVMWSHGLFHLLFFTQVQINLKCKISYIRSHQLLSIIQVLYSGDPLGAEVVVVRVGGHQQHVWEKEFTESRLLLSPATIRKKISKAAKRTNLTVLVSSATWSGNRCGSSSHLAAEISLWIFPEDLRTERWGVHVKQ